MNTKLILAPILILRTSLLLLLFPLATSAAAEKPGKYQTAAYKTVKSDGSFEIRQYPDLVVATASMEPDRSGQNSAFRSLFRYISGSNAEQQKIAMTTPVFSTKTGENKAMSFVVPRNVVANGVPKASGDKVVVTKRAKGRFAVYRYSGRWTTANETKATTKLLAWIKENKLSPLGKVETANYNSPFTLPIMRRNEVMVRLK